MSHIYEKTINRSVLVDTDRLARFIADTKLPSERISVTLECADSITRTYDSLDQLRAYPNRRSEAIRQLSLSIGRRFEDGFCQIIFRSSFLLESVKTEVYSKDENVLRNCRDAFESYFDRNAPWWGIFGSIDYSGWRALLSLTIVLVLLVWFSQNWRLIAWVPLAPVGLGWILAALVPKVFPRSSFLIGAGEARFHRAEIWRVVVLVGFLISFVASILATELYRH